MIRMKALGFDWNSLDPFPRYGPTDFPVIAPVAPAVVAPPVYNYPVITETAPVAAPAPYAVPNWVLVGGAVLAGVALASLLLKK